MIPSKWPDIELWAINLLKPLLTGVTVANQKPATVAPYKQLLVSSLPGGKETAISRSVRLNLEARVTRTAGTSNLPASFAIATDAAFHIENAVASTSFLITADIETGPSRAQDAIDDPEFHEVSLILTVLRTV